MFVHWKKAAPACLGASAAVTLLEYFRQPGMWGIGDAAVNFLLTSVTSTILVSLIFRLIGKRKI